MTIIKTIFFSFFIIANVLADASDSACYKFVNPHNKKYDHLEVFVTENGVESVTVKLANSSVVLEDQNPVVSVYTFSERCRGTQGGGWICDPAVSVPLYLDFVNKNVKALFFRPDPKTGRIWMKGESEYFSIFRVNCH
jgi:hypothetical protein